uniref:UDP-glycosyltransferases domain-containing protein n=1 Tax=Aegilops tauschii subsp. strangulata TaxID=200361 RepID=A0A453MN91_AEGTS
ELIRATKVKWLVADATVVGMCYEVAKKLAVRIACFSPMPAAYLGTLLRIPELIADGFFDDNGIPKRQGAFLLAPNTPPLYTAHVPWGVAGGPEVQLTFFQNASRNAQAARLADMVLCNTFHDAEAVAFELYPEILPIGPLFADGKTVGQFLPEDTRCIKWLDAHADNSVVYAAFGSTTVFDPSQIQELAEGLELAGRPFLWVVRPDFSSGFGGLRKAWFDEFENRTAGKGMVVSWCAQQQVGVHLITS